MIRLAHPAGFISHVLPGYLSDRHLLLWKQTTRVTYPTMLLSEDTFPLRLAIDRKTMKKQSFDDHVPPNIGAGAGAGAAGVGLTLGSTSP